MSALLISKTKSTLSNTTQDDHVFRFRNPAGSSFLLRMAFTISIRSIHVQDYPTNADKIIIMENLLYVILVILGFVAVALYFSINSDIND
jgi:hypothetical protein